MTKVLGLNVDWGRPGCGGKYGGCGWYRIINPLEKIGADVQRGEYRLYGPKTAVELKARGDIWVSRLLDSYDPMRELLVGKEVMDCKLIIDLDDDPFNLNPKHPGYEDFVKKKPLYEASIKEADHIIVSTEPIKQAVKHLNNYITVIPNAIDKEIWKVKPKKKRTDKMIRIGWFGSGSHLVELPMVVEIMKEILVKYPQVEFHMAGMVFEESQVQRTYHHIGTKGYEEYPQWVADMQLDIAIAPLLDTPFNRAKSNIKWLEHSMLKTPMVLSDVLPYSTVIDGKNGYLAKTKGQFVKKLSWLIEDEKKRKEIGENAYETVLKDYLIEKQLPKYLKLFKSMEKKDITVYTSVIGGYNKLNDSPKQEGADYVAFTDEKNELWKVKEPYDKFKDNRRNSRIQKIMPHLYFDTEYSIYLDGNIELKVSPQKLVDEWLKDKDIAVFRHVGRDCVYDEGEACLGLKRGTPKDIAEQMKAYAKKDYPKHNGLYECGVIVRRHTPKINELNEKWWAQYSRYSERDQISFPTIFKEINAIESSVWRHPYFKFIDHLKKYD